MNAPTGRAAYPTPNVATASRVPTAGSDAGKKTLLNTSAAAVP
jgi:hypothetical protein